MSEKPTTRVAPQDLVGRRFGYLTVAKKLPSNGKNSRWECVCDCGNTKAAARPELIQAHTRSCGCMTSKLKSIGRMRGQGKFPSTYSVWQSMRFRCSNPNAISYPNYGGRGIVVCDRWQKSFDDFLADMGERPSLAHSIDRIDSNGNYEPDNCRWATRKEQSRNTRRNVFLEFGGVKKTVVEWAEAVGINYAALYARVRLGWSVERVLTTPAKRCPRA